MRPVRGTDNSRDLRYSPSSSRLLRCNHPVATRAIGPSLATPGEGRRPMRGTVATAALVVVVCCLLPAGVAAAADTPAVPEYGQSATANETTQTDGDRLEPNDERVTATDVGTGGSYDDLSIHTGTDEDYFAVDVSAGEAITADVSFTHADGDLDAILVDSSGTTVASSVSISDDEAIEYTAPSDGTYYVVVYGYADAENDYDLSVTTPAGDTIGDRFEPNDHPTKATPLGGEESISGLEISDPTDEDYFAVEVDAGETVRAATTFSHREGDLELELRDRSGDVVASSTSVTDREQIERTVEEDGTYYVVVYGYAGAENDYDISLSTSAASGQFEPNDDRASATPLGSGAEYDDLTVSTVFDEDYFAVETEAGETITVDTTFDHTDGDIDVRLLNASGGEVAISQSGTDDEEIEYTADRTGTYYVVVYGYAGAENDYDISVGTTGSTDNVAPTAAITVSDSAVWRDTTVSFDARNSSDGDGIASYEWDVDSDGTTDFTGQSGRYTFDNAGAYDVTLTVTDEDGATDTTTHTVTVEDRENCSTRDADDDGLTGCEEADIGTNPTVADTDGDGFPDGVEVERSDLLPDADPLRFDIYVEVDYIDENPMSERDYERVRTGLNSSEFRNPNGEQGMALHIVEGEEVERVGTGNNPAAYQEAFQNETYACAGYHYAMVTGEQEWATALGVGSPGRFIVTDNGTGDTFMHELGHSLGLGYRGSGGELHGTFEYPWAQYQSVMNYNFPPIAQPRFSDGTESFAAHDDWGYLNRNAYTPGWEGDC